MSTVVGSLRRGTGIKNILDLTYDFIKKAPISGAFLVRYPKI